MQQETLNNSSLEDLKNELQKLREKLDKLIPQGRHAHADDVKIICLLRMINIQQDQLDAQYKEIEDLKQKIQVLKALSIF